MTALCLIKSYEGRQGRGDAQELFSTLKTEEMQHGDIAQ